MFRLRWSCFLSSRARRAVLVLASLARESAFAGRRGILFAGSCVSGPHQSPDVPFLRRLLVVVLFSRSLIF